MRGSLKTFSRIQDGAPFQMLGMVLNTPLPVLVALVKNFSKTMVFLYFNFSKTKVFSYFIFKLNWHSLFTSSVMTNYVQYPEKYVTSY